MGGAAADRVEDDEDEMKEAANGSPLAAVHLFTARLSAAFCRISDLGSRIAGGGSPVAPIRSCRRLSRTAAPPCRSYVLESVVPSAAEAPLQKYCI